MSKNGPEIIDQLTPEQQKAVEKAIEKLKQGSISKAEQETNQNLPKSIKDSQNTH